MKIKVKRTFNYQVDARTVGTIEPGVHDLPDELAYKVLRFGKAEKVPEKVAPENKVVRTPETKVSKRGRGRPRAKSDD